MQGEQNNDWMLVGRLVGPFGVHGEAKVELHTDFPDRFKNLKRVFLGPQRRPFVVEGARLHKGQVLLKLGGVERPEDVHALRGCEIVLPRSEAIPLPEGHFYLDDLLGVSVFSLAGDFLGEISEVLRTGSNDVYVVKGGRGSLLIPGIKDAVRELDLEARRLIVEPWVLEPAD